ncbi:GntR family transcriptional regulator [Streptomyces griseoviridis]
MPHLKYEMIAEHLRARIAAGEFGPGDLLPSGRDLAEQWAVSRAIVVKAFDVLRADGLVIARQGAGFTVAETPVARPAGGRHAGSSRVTGGAPYRRLGVPDRVGPPPHVAEALDLAPGETALRRVRVVLLDDGDAGSLVTAYFPPTVADAAPRLSERGAIPEGTTHYVRRMTGRRPVDGIDILTVRLATSEEAEILGIDLPAAVAVLLHTALDQNHRPLVCEEGVTPAAVFETVERYPME